VSRTYCIAIAALFERKLQSAIYSPQTGNREAKIYLLKKNWHHLIGALKNTIATPGFLRCVFFLPLPRLGKDRVLLVKDRIKKIYREKSWFFRLFKGKQKEESSGFFSQLYP